MSAIFSAAPAATWRPNRCGVCGRAATPGRWLCESCAAPTVDLSAERKHFHELDLAAREAAIRNMSQAGSSDYAIAAATNLSVEAVRKILQANGRGSAP
jgi:DNA-binding NarL/FixJ family response regulator